MSDEPADVIELLEYFLLHEPRWAFRLDDEDRAFAIRSMLPFNARFPRGGGRTFTIKDIFTYENTVKVGDEDARDVLMLHRMVDTTGWLSSFTPLCSTHAPAIPAEWTPAVVVGPAP